MFRLSRFRVCVLLIAVTVLLPSRWWAIGVPVVTHAQAAAAQAAPPQTYEGILNVVWGDPRLASVRSEMKFSLAMADGSSLALQMTGQENLAIAYFGKRVVVTGRPGARPAAIAGAGAADESAIIVDSIGPAQPPAQGFAGDVSAAPAIGTKRVLFLLLKFQDDTAVPHPPSFFLNLANPDTGSAGIPATINGFFKKTSNDQFSWIADVGGAGGIGAPSGDGWITLPQPKSAYANCDFSTSCLDINKITADSVAAGKGQLINFANYDNINFVYSNDLDCCAWGGSRTIDGKTFGVTWEPPWGQETDTYSHEMGHSLGLPHSGWVYFAYDSPWDVMSSPFAATTANCGSYFSRNDGGNSNLTCTEPGASYIAAYRDYLGWIPAANIVQTAAGSTVNTTLEGAALPMGSTPKMIKICLPGFACAGSGARYFTVEARVKGGGANTQFDNGITGEGVIIHDVQTSRPSISGACFFNNQSGWAVPVDATPGDYNSTGCNAGGRTLPNYALYNAQFTAGQTYTNSTYGFRVSVGARSGATFAVSVTPIAVPSDMALDSPTNGSPVGRPFTVQGWALNRSAASGTGVDAIHVYAVPAGGGSPIFLGVPTYGTARGDVGAAFGSSQFNNSGFTMSAGASLAPGSYTVTAYAHNSSTGAFDATRSANVSIAAPASNGALYVDSPAPGAIVTSAFEVSGWAADLGAATGTGVDAIHFYVQSNGAPAPGAFAGAAAYGSARGDVGAIFGSQFTNSGFHLTITGMAPGSGVLGVYAHSTVTGAFSIVRTVPFTVNANQLMSIDVPSPEATVTGPNVSVAGWAIDRATASGTGVDMLHVYAYPNPGSGRAPIFLGLATLGFERPDVAAVFADDRYRFSGYALTVNAASAGLVHGTVYSIAVHAHSTSGTFNNLAVVRMTFQ
jgi:hypothetical protein